MDSSEGQIIAAQQGDLDAFQEIVQQHMESGLRYAHSILGDHHLAEDAVQEAFASAFLNLGQLREPPSFRAWLRRIVYKHCDRILRQRHMALVSLESILETASKDRPPDQEAEAADLRNKIRSLIASLPPGQRKAVELYYFGDYSQKEIGASQQIPISTVKNLLRSARKTLRERIEYMLTVHDHELTSIAPQFLVDDLPTACSYYKDKLGFKVDFIYEGFYAGLSRNSILLHLKCAPKTVSDRRHRKDNEHLDAHVAVHNVGGLHKEFRANGAKIIKELEVRPWNCKDFYVEDPDGYIICFSEGLES